MTDFTGVFGDLDSSSVEFAGGGGGVDVLLCVKTRLCSLGDVGLTSLRFARELLLAPATAFKVSLVQQGAPPCWRGRWAGCGDPIGYNPWTAPRSSAFGVDREGSGETVEAGMVASVPIGKRGPVIVEEGVVKAPVDPRQKCAVIPAEATEVAEVAFRGCGSLEEEVFFEGGKVQRIAKAALQRLL